MKNLLKKKLVKVLSQRIIITIIVMLILVAVTISTAINEGLFEYAGKAVDETRNAINAEQQLAGGRIKIGDKWYASIDDYINNKPIQQSIKIEGTLEGALNLKIESDYDSTTAPVTGQLTATLKEIEGTVTWTSDNEEVAKVSNTGLVTAIAAGTAKITASVTQEGVTRKDECKVTVETKMATITTADSYVGCYADFDGNGIPEGIIYADLAHTVSGRWNNNNMSGYSYTAESGFKSYYIKEENYTEGVFDNNDENEKIAMIAPVEGTTGKDRFYVMALEDITTAGYSTFNWYLKAYGKLDRPVATDYNDFGAGKSNTIAMLNDWNNNTATYGKQNTSDIWGAIQEDEIKEKYPIVTSENDSQKWFVPSKAEWSAFGDYLYTKLGVTTVNYGNYGLRGYYWSSSQVDTTNAYYARFSPGYVLSNTVQGYVYVRLSATF